MSDPSSNLARARFPPTLQTEKLRAVSGFKLTYNFSIKINSTKKMYMFFQAAEDVNVTFEDQQKINKFARNTSRITELKEEIEVKKKQLQNLEDACEDIMLADDDCLMVPYQIGDVFISHSQEETQEMLEEAKEYCGEHS
ncbi:hypothetical protein J1605_012884 [Eschrichtius robustus]|uniref:Prefoldin subunit 4 n=1 Tax=Eschrichtius robustus TaxID=9764 RepID=A0AB34GIW2_ESCRO|nr:hypothetical protein J1605_012884 [Eschrichtius robustus]